VGGETDTGRMKYRRIMQGGNVREEGKERGGGERTGGGGRGGTGQEPEGFKWWDRG